ncbi:hypothetical protein [Sorangium sp. So ce1335]|uniref:hypothetical protein n=1 Tax=Sorangium sp. So ce1335 TaxID=3133335 RepID=UPI003F63FB71
MIIIRGRVPARQLYGRARLDRRFDVAGRRGGGLGGQRAGAPPRRAGDLESCELAGL